MANRLDIGEAVAAQMQQIVQSEEHKRVFFKGADKKCCSCTTCGKDCPCEKCSKDCKGCADHGHVHDSNCSHDKTANAVNEIIDLLQKISSVQDELGLVNSSIFTMKALAMMVVELKKTAQDDTNDISFDELIKTMDPESREGFQATEFNDPDIVALLKQRIQESHEGKESAPFDFEAGVSADPTSSIPTSVSTDLPEFGEGVVYAPEGHDTWGPGSSVDPILLPEPTGKEDIPQLPELNIGGRGRSNTLHSRVDAFKHLNEMMKKYAEGNDFEEESEEEDDELAELMGDIPGGRQMRGHELAEMLSDEEDSDRDLFDIPLDADDNYTSDLDEELESGNFLESPDEDGGPGFTYGPDETYPIQYVKKGPFGGLELEEVPEEFQHGESHKVRVPKKFYGTPDWVEFNGLTPEEQDEQLAGAGLHEQLDIDPDHFSDEEVYPEKYEFDDNEDLMRHQISDKTSHDPSDDEYDYRQSHLWGSDE